VTVPSLPTRVTTFATRRRRFNIDARPDGPRAPGPPSASARAYMRASLPAVFRENDFAMRFVGALETVLDPIVATIDSLPAYVDPRLAPSDMLEVLAAWLGIEFDESMDEATRRELVLQSAEATRWRGTLRGLEMALRLTFPDLPLRIEDEGGVVFTRDAASDPAPAANRFIVYCDTPIPAARQAVVARVIEEQKPLHVAYRLRVKAAAARKKAAE
jgi:phage tail-like protein